MCGIPGTDRITLASEQVAVMNSLVTSGSASSADRRCSAHLFVDRRIRDSRTWFTADRVVGAYAQCVAGSLVADAGIVVAKTQAWCRRIMDRVLVFAARYLCDSGCLHGGCGVGRRQRDDHADGRTSARALSRKPLPRDFHQSFGVFVRAHGAHLFRTYSLGSSYRTDRIWRKAQRPLRSIITTPVPPARPSCGNCGRSNRPRSPTWFSMTVVVRHAELKGVTPEMLVWWYGHVDGDMRYAGQRWSRYLRGRERRHRIPNGS